MLIGLILDHLITTYSGVEAPLKKSALNGLKVYVDVDKVTGETFFFVHSHLRIALCAALLIFHLIFKIRFYF
jgi:hypothetical protein